MFISKHKYMLEKLIDEQRIEYLEHMICPNGHDYVDLFDKNLDNKPGGVKICSRCRKLKDLKI